MVSAGLYKLRPHLPGDATAVDSSSAAGASLEKYIL